MLCTCHFCGVESLTVGTPTLAPGSTAHYYIVCDDPVLAEWPSAWGTTGSLWGLTPAANTGLIETLPMSLFQVPAEFDPVVLDPGYSASELDFNTNAMPTQTVYSHIQFRYNSVRAGYVKGVDVGVLTVLETNKRYLFPTGGATLDLTALHAPDPRVIALGPDYATPTRKSSWGDLKLHYR